MFNVGSVRYSVRLAHAPIMLDGVRYLGRCLERERFILISPDVPIDGRLNVLLHELAHAHIFASGMPGDVEGWCDLFATVAELAYADLTRCGGEPALQRLEPGQELRPSMRVVGLTRSRTCACGGTIAPGDVSCVSDPGRPGLLTLTMECEFCGHRMTWDELETFGGLPGGVVVGEPRIEKGTGASPALS